MEQKAQVAPEVRKGMQLLAWSMLLGLATVPVYALYSADRSKALVAWSVGSLLCGAAALTGVLLGFLFGIPRTQQAGSNRAPTPPTDARPPAAGTDKPAQPVETGSQTAQPPSVSYHPNTNLEEISDWLTKILVGVGLTQIDAIRQGFFELTRQAALGLGNQPHGQIYAAALIAFSIVPGFLYGFLWTRLFLPKGMRDADQEALGALAQSVQQASREVKDFKKQVELDTAALNLVSRQLNPQLPAVEQDKLEEALLLASRPTRVQAFNKAWKVRADNWRDPARKDTMARAIPIFRALIRNDPKQQYHMNHGQLGFALKDMKPPMWQEAEAELSTAISIRGDWREQRWLYYELARAMCRINRDPGFLSGQESTPAARTAILADLQTALHDEEIRNILTHPRDDEPGVAAILKWLERNQLSLAQLIADA